MDQPNEQVARAFVFAQGRLVELMAKLDWMDEKTGGTLKDSLEIIRDDMQITRKRLFALEKHWRERQNMAVQA